jgi:hypothetical protein
VALAAMGALVFWELNGLSPGHRPGVVFNVVRRAMGREDRAVRVAQLAEVRRYDRHG